MNCRDCHRDVSGDKPRVVRDDYVYCPDCIYYLENPWAKRPTDASSSSGAQLQEHVQLTLTANESST